MQFSIRGKPGAWRGPPSPCCLCATQGTWSTEEKLGVSNTPKEHEQGRASRKKKTFAVLGLPFLARMVGGSRPWWAALVAPRKCRNNITHPTPLSPAHLFKTPPPTTSFQNFLSFCSSSSHTRFKHPICEFVCLSPLVDVLVQPQASSQEAATDLYMLLKYTRKLDFQEHYTFTSTTPPKWGK
jgi:hypothetical protein